MMLEGQLVHLPAPKSHFAKDTVFDSDTPILATSKHQLVFVKKWCDRRARNGDDDGEMESVQF